MRNLRGVALATVFAFQIAGCATQAADETVVTVANGSLQGVVEDGVVSWKGIPFAAPPVGELRWRAPQPDADWEGTRDAAAYGNDCMQQPFPSDAAPLGTPPSEDCLYANVWRPAGSAEKLPVVVWIYGGGFVNGGASPPTYSGAEMARQDVLFMSFNYRVGRFGTFAHPALTRAAEEGELLGNYGFMDQLAALQWVRQNIAAFGGDPDNVTVIGESAGGMSANTLLTSPMTEGLIHRAVVMSGGDGKGMGPSGLQVAETIGSEFGRKNGIEPDDPDALAKLRALSADQVTDGLNMMALFAPGDGPRTFASPFADGKLAVPADEAYRVGNFPRVPVMIGATGADIGGRTGSMVKGARDLATAIAGHGVPVYAYRFTYVADSAVDTAPPDGAAHATEIPFFFNTQAVKYEGATTERDNAVGRTASAYVVNFAKTGDPNGTGLPDWPRYDRSVDVIMDFNREGNAVAGKDPWAAEMDAASR